MNNPNVAPRISAEKLSKYPFLNASIKWMSQQDVDPVDAFYSHVGIKSRLEKLFTDALQRKEETNALLGDSFDTLYLFPWIRLLLAIMGIPRLVHMVANLVSKYYGDQLESEDKETIWLIAYDLGFHVELLKEEKALKFKSVVFPLSVPFAEYLRFTSSFKDPSWKLVNRLVHDGKVYLREHDVARIIQEHIKMRITDAIHLKLDHSLKDKIEQDPLIKPFIESMKKDMQEQLKTTATTGEFTGPVDDSAYPPCVNYILDKSDKGINLAHTERVFLVSFMLTIGQDGETIVSLFRNQPDFDESKTRYQLGTIRGDPTDPDTKAKYTPHNCATLLALNMCKKDDPQFGSDSCMNPKFPFKNPLVFYHRLVRWKAKRASNQQNQSNNGSAGEAGGKKDDTGRNQGEG